MIRRTISATLTAVGRAQHDFHRFLALEVSGGILLLAAAIIALALANSPAAESYAAFWEIPMGIHVGGWEITETLIGWIDDGLMALFFFVVGLEIKREVLVGELSSARKASLPIVAALGGMVAPAVVYLAFNSGGPGASGWGVPMATDIAFALGVLALLGSAVPVGLKVFLTALAIADDIGAIIVIAMFYTESIHWSWLGLGIALLLVLVGFNRAGVDSPVPYALVGIVVWFCFLHSGIHATIAGVLIAFTIPAVSRTRPMEFVQWARKTLDHIEQVEVPDAHVLDDPQQQHAAFEIRAVARHVAAPLQRLEHALQPVTTYVILPLFALANAGVALTGYDLSVLVVQPVTIGVFLGLIVGKSVGIFSMTWVAIKLKLADLPPEVTWGHIAGAGILGGIGFTMSLFVSNLAFTDPLLIAEAKFAILVTSLAAGGLGYAFLRVVASRTPSASTS